MLEQAQLYFKLKISKFSKYQIWHT